jgi:hypothetical protein
MPTICPVSPINRQNLPGTAWAWTASVPARSPATGAAPVQRQGEHGHATGTVLGSVTRDGDGAPSSTRALGPGTTARYGDGALSSARATPPEMRTGAGTLPASPRGVRTNGQAPRHRPGVRTARPRCGRRRARSPAECSAGSPMTGTASVRRNATLPGARCAAQQTNTALCRRAGTHSRAAAATAA